ncbi:MAG TPA: hypothetical protein VFO73_15065 [Candidatus Limnocylindrales bacterium]|jgi:hypothetical protein|nr:hypothetical protein [Candidatus Limnocylindrales bacterium]
MLQRRTRQPRLAGDHVEHGALAHIAGAAGIVGHLAAAYFYLLYPALSVPAPENYVFFVAWAVILGLAALWWRDHPWRSLLVPLVSVATVIVLLELGARYLGWAP